MPDLPAMAVRASVAPETAPVVAGRGGGESARRPVGGEPGDAGAKSSSGGGGEMRIWCERLFWSLRCQHVTVTPIAHPQAQCPSATHVGTN